MKMTASSKALGQTFDYHLQVSVDMIADMAAGAFSGGFPALA